MSLNYTSRVLLVQRCQYPAKSVAVKDKKSDKKHHPAKINPTIQHLCNNKVPSVVLLV